MSQADQTCSITGYILYSWKRCEDTTQSSRCRHKTLAPLNYHHGSASFDDPYSVIVLGDGRRERAEYDQRVPMRCNMPREDIHTPLALLVFSGIHAHDTSVNVIQGPYSAQHMTTNASGKKSSTFGCV